MIVKKHWRKYKDLQHSDRMGLIPFWIHSNLH